MMRTRLVGRLLVLFLLAWAQEVTAGPRGFVYVLQSGFQQPESDNYKNAELLIFDGGTAQLVTRIPLFLPYGSGIAVSPDGAHVYVSTFRYTLSGPRSGGVGVIDARRHVYVGTFNEQIDGLPVNGPIGDLAVNGDDSVIYARSPYGLLRFDVATRKLSAPVIVGNGDGLVFDRAIERVVVPVANIDGSGYISLHDPVTLAEVQRVTLTAMRALSLSRSGGELLGIRTVGSGSSLIRLDATTLEILDDRPVALNWGYGTPSPLDSPQRSSVYLAALNAVGVMNTLTSTFSTIALPEATDVLSLTIPPGERDLFISSYRPSGTTGLRGLSAIDLASGQIVSNNEAVGGEFMVSTPEGAESCTYRLGTSYASFPDAAHVSSGGGLSRPISLTTECAWQASAAESWVHLSSVAGVGSATLTITVDPNVSSSIRQSRVNIGGQLVTVTQAGVVSSPAFGFVDTPEDFSTGISGSLAVTGWAMDDVGVATVHIYRDPVAGEPQTLIPLGDATFVDGARPDVQAIYSTLPFASRAGWGYMLLTNMLPGGGDGTYRVHVYAEDIEGHQTLLGTRTFTASNSTAVLPFGALDTPGQGETVSGEIMNWGWALTPQPADIPMDGSTIDVILDGVAVGHPTYGFDRPDIASLFPGYANTNSAVGYFTIDTATLTNGVHTIAWVVRDSLGRAQGIGSRYFTVQNP